MLAVEVWARLLEGIAMIEKPWMTGENPQSTSDLCSATDYECIVAYICSSFPICGLLPLRLALAAPSLAKV